MGYETNETRWALKLKVTRECVARFASLRTSDDGLLASIRNSFRRNIQI